MKWGVVLLDLSLFLLELLNGTSVEFSFASPLFPAIEFSRGSFLTEEIPRPLTRTSSRPARPSCSAWARIMLRDPAVSSRKKHWNYARRRGKCREGLSLKVIADTRRPSDKARAHGMIETRWVRFARWRVGTREQTRRRREKEREHRPRADVDSRSSFHVAFPSSSIGLLDRCVQIPRLRPRGRFVTAPCHIGLLPLGGRSLYFTYWSSERLDVFTPVLRDSASFTLHASRTRNYCSIVDLRAAASTKRNGAGVTSTRAVVVRGSRRRLTFIHLVYLRESLPVLAHILLRRLTFLKWTR